MPGRVAAAGGGGPASESPPRLSGRRRCGRRHSTLNSGKTRHVAGMSSRYVFGAVRARTRKGPIHRGGSSERDGRAVCFVSGSTSSPTANCTSRQEASSSALRRSCPSCNSARTSAVTSPIRCVTASLDPAGSGAAEGGRVRGARRHNPPLVEQEGHLFSALVELLLRPALHRPRARHRVRIRLDAQLQRRAAVRRQAGQRVRKHVGILEGIAVVRRLRNRRPVGGERDLADAVPSASVVHESTRPASVSSAHAAVANPASAAMADRRPGGGGQRDGLEKQARRARAKKLPLF